MVSKGNLELGMTSLVSILITDLVPLREVASWRSYVNVAATTGRSIGGPLGGWLTDTVGWRWSFLIQTPLAGIAMLLITMTLPASTNTLDDDEPKESNLGRVDFIGALFLTLTILMFLFPLEVGGDRVPWSHPLIVGLLCGAVIAGALFLVVEARFAREPIVPISLLRHKDVVASSFAMICQASAQIGVSFSTYRRFRRYTEISSS